MRTPALFFTDKAERMNFDTVKGVQPSVSEFRLFVAHFLEIHIFTGG